MKNICVVGNSGDILNEDLGKNIDKCDEVIRIQRFKTTGFESHVGSKTTIFASKMRSTDKVVNAIQYSEIDIKNVNFWCVALLETFRKNTCMQVLGHANVPSPSSDLYNRIVKKCYSGYWRQVPSAGIIALEMAREIFSNSNVYICGFDGNLDKNHYYDPTIIDRVDPNYPGPGHNWSLEWAHIQELISNGSISHIRNLR